MQIAVLGPLEVMSDDGGPIAVPGAKERLLLAVLVAGAPDVVSRDLIEHVLWNGDRPASARKSLQVHLVHLRSALEPGRPQGSTGRYVVRRGTGYALTAEREDVDALRIADLASRGRAQLVAGDPADAARLLTAALDLWRGQPYGDWPDLPFADAERHRLAEVRTGAVTALLQARLALGEHAEVAAEAQRLVVEDALHEEWWRLLALALYRGGRQGEALAALARARSVLAAEIGADPGPTLRAMEAAVLAQDPALDPAPAVPPARPAPPDVAACPYKGLATYQAADSALFRGRGRVVSRLAARLVDAPLVAVSGSSGAGKSSLVRAGLLPALAAGALPGSAGWRSLVVTPGRRPVDALAPLTGRSPPDSPVLLVCDQLEELWAPDVDAAERSAFLDAVLGLLDDGIVVRCVVAVRGDHVGRLAEHAAFTERLGSAVVLVPPLTEAELREVVREPAGAVGLTVEDELADAVVADVLGRPGALPLLSTALVGTWERRRGDRLTLAGYLESGGVTGSLSRSAEAAWAVLDEEGRETARRLLVRLADTDEGGALIRRPVPLAELDLDGDRGAVRRAVIDGFVVRRLLSLDGDRLDVVHEALLTGWPRLTRWLDEDAAGRAVRRHLTPAAVEWQRRGRPDDELYRGARLGAALDWAAAADDELTTGEREFLDASKARADAELRAAQQQARAEARGRRRLRWLATGLAGVLVVAMVTAVLAVRAQRAADRTSLTADANRLAALSGTAESLDLAYLLAAQAFRLRDTPETRDALLASLTQQRRVIRATTINAQGPIGGLTDDGRTVFVGAEGTGGQILSWPVDSSDPPRVVLETQEGWEGWQASAWSPTDPVVVTAGTDGSGLWVRTVDADGVVRDVLRDVDVGGQPAGAVVLPDGRRARLLVVGAGEAGQATWRLIEVDLAEGSWREGAARGAAPGPLGALFAQFSTDGATAVLSDFPSRAAVHIDLEAGRQVPLEEATDDPAIFFGYRALPSGAAVFGSDGNVTLHDGEGRIRQQFNALPSVVDDLDLAPDGTWGVTVGEEGGIVLWDVDATGRWSKREVVTGPRGPVGTAMIDPSGDRLYTLSKDNMLTALDVSPEGGFGSPRPGMPDRWIPDEPAVVEPGELVVMPTRPFGSAVSGDYPYYGPGTSEVAATFVDPRTGEVVEEIVVGHTLEESEFLASVAVSPDRGLIAVNSGLAVTILDAGSRRQVASFSLPSSNYPGPDGQPRPVGVVGCLAWSADGSRLFVGTQSRLPAVNPAPEPATGGGALFAVDTGSWEVVDETGVDVVPETIALGPDGRSLALGGGWNASLEIRDAATLDERTTVELDNVDRLADLSWSADGAVLLAAGRAGPLHVVDTATWEARAPAFAADAPRMQIEWLPDGHTVVLTGVSTVARLFDVERSVARTGLPAAVGELQAATYLVPDPTDDLLFLIDRDWVMRYPTAPSAWLRAACGVPERDLTRAEWDRYLPGRPYEATCSDLG